MSYSVHARYEMSSCLDGKAADDHTYALDKDRSPSRQRQRDQAAAVGSTDSSEHLSIVDERADNRRASVGASEDARQLRVRETAVKLNM